MVSSSEIAKEYTSGSSIDDLSIKYNITSKAIYKSLKKHSVNLRPIIHEKSNEIIQDYQNNISLNKIKNKYKISNDTIYHVLKIHNIDIRPRLNNKKTKNCSVCRNNYFSYSRFQKYCSTKCRLEADIIKTKRTCVVCSNEFKYKHYTHKTCSVECGGKLIGHATAERIRTQPWKLGTSSGKSGKRTDLNNKYFRSSWEANYARYLNHLNIQWEYEPKYFDFVAIRRGTVGYLPDFYLPVLDQWIEIKGWFDNKSKTKIVRFKKYYPNEFNKMAFVIHFNKTKPTPAKEWLLKIGVVPEKIINYDEIVHLYKDKLPNWE